jgi:hypothetical protein
MEETGLFCNEVSGLLSVLVLNIARETNNATAIFKALPTFDIVFIYPSFLFYHKTFHLALQNGGTKRSDWHDAYAQPARLLSSI